MQIAEPRRAVAGQGEAKCIGKDEIVDAWI